MTGKAPVAFSIYSGAGGIDIGFEHAGFRIAYAADHWDIACKTLEKNAKGTKVECKDIREVDFRSLKSELAPDGIDCLMGGPPCPAFSKSRFYLKHKKRALMDENSFTVAQFFRAVEELEPKAFFFENVHGFVYRPHYAAFEYVRERAKELGYAISWKVLNAADYGVPQMRERFICVGAKKGLPVFEFPRATHRDPASAARGFRTPWVTCGEAIGDLDVDMPEDSSMQAGSKHKDLLRQIPPGDNYLYFTKERGYPSPKFTWRSRYWSFLLKLSPEKPSWTIQASHSNNMGPFHWKNRFLRIAEIKRLQTFPDDYAILGSYREQWRQVGNAVPPLLARILASEIRKQVLEGKTKRPTLRSFAEKAD